MSLSAPKRFVNVLLSSVVAICPHSLIIDNLCDFWFDSGKTFDKSFDSFDIWVRGMTRFEMYAFPFDNLERRLKK